MHKILGVITARGGSKGIPRKNIKEFLGKPLIAHTIDASLGSAFISDLIVSTDDKEIASIAKVYGVDVPFLRPKELAEDDTPTLPVLQHAVLFMEKKLGEKFDYVVTLQPTSPLRITEDIDKTIQLITDEEADSAVSLVEVESGAHPMKMKRLEGVRVLPYAMEEPEGTRRQDLPPCYKRSGAVYVHKRDLVMNENKLYGNFIVGHIVPRERSVDIDEEVDWIVAEHLAKNMAKRYGK